MVTLSIVAWCMPNGTERNRTIFIPETWVPQNLDSPPTIVMFYFHPMRELAAILDINGPVFYTISKFLWVLQLGLILHVYKTGRPYYWIWILFGFPIAGGLAYTFIEILPEYRRPGMSVFSVFQTRRGRIKKLKEKLEETDTVQNRIALTAELRRAGRLEEAEEVMLECLHGVFKDDPYTLCEMGRVYADRQKWKELLNTIGSANQDQDRMIRAHLELLQARGLAGLGQMPEAEAMLRRLSLSHLGEEARFRLAVLLAQTDRKKEAEQLFHEIVKKFRKGNRSWRKTEREWFKAAKMQLKALKV
jgi:hypothetical protein